MNTVSFEFLPEPNSFLRVKFEKHAGRILKFVIQLECLWEFYCERYAKWLKEKQSSPKTKS